MSKASSKNQQEKKDYKVEIDRLKKKIDGLRSKSQIAALESQIETLRKQSINDQNAREQSMTNIPGYEEEFARLKEDAVKQIRKGKNAKIGSSLVSLITIPIVAVIVYFVFETTKIISFLELSGDSTRILYWVTAVVFTLLETQAFFDLIKTILINPEKIPDQTLSYLSLTAKEHILDPKGSVIREKYGTGKWSSVTET
ncbi:MAG: hypothetical protein ABIC57_01490 [bacterium]